MLLSWMMGHNCHVIYLGCSVWLHVTIHHISAAVLLCVEVCWFCTHIECLTEARLLRETAIG